jgi:hypothetical protein
MHHLAAGPIQLLRKVFSEVSANYFFAFFFYTPGMHHLAAGPIQLLRKVVSEVSANYVEMADKV